MPDKNAKADDLIPGKLKKSKSYHAEYGQWTFGEIVARPKPSRPTARRGR
jgi:hypothetical protein